MPTLAPAPIAATPTPAAPVTINSTNAAPATPIAYTTPAPTPIPNISTLDTSVTPTPASPDIDEANSLTSQLADLNTSLEGESTDETADEATLGVPALQATQNDLSAQLTGLQNEAAAIPNQLQLDATGRGITADGLAPMQTARLRTNSIAALGVSTLLAASKGQIANAQSQAQQMVAAKYDPIQEQITAATANLKLIQNSPEYSAEEKAQAAAQLQTQNEKQAQLDQAKTNYSDVQNIAITAAQNGAPATLLKEIQGAADGASAASIAGGYGVAPTKTTTSVQSVNGRKLLIDDQTGVTIKDLGADTTSTGSTAADKLAAANTAYSAAFVPGAKMADGTPVIDNNGFLTPAAFKAAAADAPANGMTRSQFITNFGYLIYAPKGVPSAAYGLTPAEGKLLTGTTANVTLQNGN